MKHFNIPWYILQRANWREELLRSEKKVIELAQANFSNAANSKVKIRNIEDFRAHIPIVTKKDLFAGRSLSDLVGKDLKSVNFVMMSSGSSTKFSLGVFTQKEMKKAANSTDIFFRMFFGAKDGETFIINASSMGVRVFTNFVVSDTGPRIDIVLGLLKQVAISYKTIFIVADPIFIKLLVEESIREGVDWNDYRVFFVSGGEWMPESLRDYVHLLTNKSGKNPEKGCWVGTYGITEIGYPLFFENAELVAWRSNEYKNMKADLSLANIPRVTTPFYFFFRAGAFYLENISGKCDLPRLVFTPLNKKKLIKVWRYDTGDLGELMINDELNLSFQPMPVVRFWGRDENYIELTGIKIFITDIKELFFSAHNILSDVTGYFTLRKENQKIIVEIQVKKGIDANSMCKDYLQLLFDSVYPDLLSVQFVAYYDMRQQMELDFERKFNHVI